MCKMRHFYLPILFLTSLYAAPPALSQDAARPPEQFASTATAIDGVSLLTNRYMVTLWGVEPIEATGTTLAIKARTALDNLINGQPVTCEVKEWRSGRPVARCLNAQEADLALSMVQNGYAVADRPGISGTVFDAQYKDAEKKAQHDEKGGWADAAKDTSFLKYFAGNDRFVYGWIIGVFLLPLLAALFGVLFLSVRFSRLEAYLKDTLGASEARKKELREQERFVVASMIEGELSANKGKLEAFIIIYKDLLKSLRQSKDRNYQVHGEIVHDAPLLQRIVYESNINRLNLLGSSIAGEVVGLYGHIQSDPQYTTLNAAVPMDEAILKVQKVVSDAEALIPRIDKIIQSLHITIRDNQMRQMRSSL